MKNTFLRNFSITALVTSFTMTFLTTHAAYADLADDAKGGVGELDGGLSQGSAEGVLETIVNTLLFLIGAVSVIMIIVGGLRYIFSQGDPQSAASAKNTVIYSVVGLIVAVTAYAIVSYVLDKVYT